MPRQLPGAPPNRTCYPPWSTWDIRAPRQKRPWQELGTKAPRNHSTSCSVSPWTDSQNRDFLSAQTAGTAGALSLPHPTPRGGSPSRARKVIHYGAAISNLRATGIGNRRPTLKRPSWRHDSGTGSVISWPTAGPRSCWPKIKMVYYVRSAGFGFLSRIGSAYMFRLRAPR